MDDRSRSPRPRYPDRTPPWHAQQAQAPPPPGFPPPCHAAQAARAQAMQLQRDARVTAREAAAPTGFVAQQAHVRTPETPLSPALGEPCGVEATGPEGASAPGPQRTFEIAEASIHGNVRSSMRMDGIPGSARLVSQFLVQGDWGSVKAVWSCEDGKVICTTWIGDENGNTTSRQINWADHAV